MGRTKINPSFRGNLIHGEFLLSEETNGSWTSRCPGDFSDELGVVQFSYSSIDKAVESARGAFRAWRRLPQTERSEALRRYQACVHKREDELAEIIARESGKPLWEAKSEVAGMLNKVDVTLSDSLRMVQGFEIPAALDNADGACRYRPLGVMAVIGPFNFPAHLPSGHILPALATGNTVVFKPSEKTPFVGQVLAECFQEAGFPPGVFNLIHGDREVGRRLCAHEGVDGVLFTGSYETGTRIKQDTLQQHWKLLALEMGGKNPAILWHDTPLDVAVHETLVGAYITAGQRCSATSRILVHRKILESFLAEFHKRAKTFSIGHPLEDPFMGPLIEQGSVDRYMKFVGIASREGCELVMRGKVLELATAGNYVTPSICWVKDGSLEAARKSVFQQTEIFAPAVAVTAFDEIEEAVALANCSQYGLVASVFSKDRAIYEKAFDGLQMGMVNWNKSTVGASSRLPFGGLKKSGNHFPTALGAVLYCTYPVASLEVSDPTVKSRFPGLE